MASMLSANLDRTDSSTPWGFRLHGGKDFGCPLTIQRVTPGSLAAKCGLQVGDAILKIGDQSTDQLRHKEAQSTVISQGNSLNLSLKRGGGSAMPPPVDSYQPSTPSYNSYSNPAPQPYSTQNNSVNSAPGVNYNVKPKPFGGSGGGFGGGVGSLTSGTANMNLGPGPQPPWKTGGGSSAPIAPTGGSGGGGGTWQPNMPTGDRRMRVGKMGEARSMPATGGAGRIPICNSCGTAIRGPFVLALDKSWCPDHFNCANPNCRRPLIDCGFVEEDGQLYCEKDYEQYMAPRCGKCGGAIVGEIVNAMKNTYHMTCFVCVQCHQPIGTGSFHVEEGRVYCQKDWAQLFQTKCYGCQFPIEPGDRWVEALGQNWHSECFNCSTCQVNLEGQPFFAKGGKPFCKTHATAGGGRFG